MIDMSSKLERLKHLTCPLHVKIGAVNTGVLSMLDYSPHPSVPEVKKLRGKVKTAIGQPYGAAEIVLWVGNQMPIDPFAHWMLVAMRTWAHASRMDPTLLTKVKSCKSRLANLRRECKKLNIDIDVETLKFGDMNPIEWRTSWKDIRPRCVKVIRRAHLMCLARRRPGTYEGLEGNDILVKNHAKLLSQVDAREASILIRIWAGAAMTLEHRSKIDANIDPQCPCGEGVQSVHHLVFRCRLQAPLEVTLEPWRDLPPCNACALLCTENLNEGYRDTWKAICMRAVRILGGLSTPPPSFDFLWKPHLLHNPIPLR